MRQLTVAMAMLALGVASAQDRSKPNQAPKPAEPDGILWVGDWDEAVKEAKARNVPIHFALHKDN